MKRALLALVLAALVAIGCDHKETNGGGPAVVDTELMAFLSEARSLHHQADIKEDAGDLPGAISAIDRLVNAQRPHPDRPAPEVEEVLADAYARLAELRLKKGDLAPAGDAITRGLEHAPGSTYFRGHLLEVQGLVEKARSAELADAGKPGEAQKAREHAIQVLDEAIKIQADVIQRSLGKDGGTEAGR